MPQLLVILIFLAVCSIRELKDVMCRSARNMCYRRWCGDDRVGIILRAKVESLLIAVL
jgi:hypothetical protein